MGETTREGDCEEGGNVVEFDSPVDQLGSTHRIAYYKEERSTPDGIGTYTLKRCEGVNKCVDIVSRDVNIDILKFYVRGSKFDDNIQPSVRILIRGKVTIKGIEKTFSLQTMASQRSTETTL